MENKIEKYIKKCKKVYGEMTSQEINFLSLVELRESLAIQPGEIYRIGSNPQRERKLKELTDKLEGK